jgi:hypothetical protein
LLLWVARIVLGLSILRLRILWLRLILRLLYILCRLWLILRLRRILRGLLRKRPGLGIACRCASKGLAAAIAEACASVIARAAAVAEGLTRTRRHACTRLYPLSAVGAEGAIRGNLLVTSGTKNLSSLRDSGNRCRS